MISRRYPYDRLAHYMRTMSFLGMCLIMNECVPCLIASPQVLDTVLLICRLPEHIRIVFVVFDATVER